MWILNLWLCVKFYLHKLNVQQTSIIIKNKWEQFWYDTKFFKKVVESTVNKDNYYINFSTWCIVKTCGLWWWAGQLTYIGLCITVYSYNFYIEFIFEWIKEALTSNHIQLISFERIKPQASTVMYVWSLSISCVGVCVFLDDLRRFLISSSTCWGSSYCTWGTLWPYLTRLYDGLYCIENVSDIDIDLSILFDRLLSGSTYSEVVSIEDIVSTGLWMFLDVCLSPQTHKRMVKVEETESIMVIIEVTIDRTMPKCII